MAELRNTFKLCWILALGLMALGLTALGSVQAADGETAAPGQIQYQDVLSDPDNIAQNAAYARQLIDRGELRHAAATLERVILKDPGQIDLRLLYTSVLIRLDSHAQARVELDQLDALSLSPSQRAAVDKMMRALAIKDHKLMLTGYLGMGAQSDDNIGANPASGTAFAFDVPLPTGEDQDDTSIYTMGYVALHRQINANRNNQFFTSLSVYNSDQQDLDFLDYWTAGLKLGLLLNRGDRKYRFGPTGRVLELNGHKYYQHIGVSFRGDQKFSENVSGWLWARIDEEDFFDVGPFSTSSLRSGQRRRIGAGVTLFGSHKLQYSVEGQIDQKDADYGPYGYDGFEARARIRRTFAKDASLWADVTYRAEDYDGANTLISDIVREDDLYRYQVGASFPLKGLFNRSKKPGRNAAKLSVSYSYYDSQSSVANYEFESNRLRFGLTKAFSAGY
jgi:hypothetical protein